MDIIDFFEPVNRTKWMSGTYQNPLTLGSAIHCHDTENGFPSLDNIKIALMGVKEDRLGFTNEGCALAPDYVRKYLYQLFQGPFRQDIADLGNIRTGDQVNDTYFAVRSVVSELLKQNIVPVVIGGSQDITYAVYQAYVDAGKIVNIVAVDSRFDISPRQDEPVNHTNYLSCILAHKPSVLFNYTNLGYQTYFVDQDAIELMEKLYFDIYRLGFVRKDLEEVEPIVRSADMLTFDMSSIRQSDAPASANASPNGFYGEEACQIVRYAGLSDKLTSIGFYELNPAFDKGEQTAHLLAQMIWYFIDGFYNRKNDIPYLQGKEMGDFIRYVVSVKDMNSPLVFLKSKKTDRWWMEVPFPDGGTTRFARQCLVPCSFKDYQAACKEEIPDKWWQVYQKLM